VTVSSISEPGSTVTVASLIGTNTLVNKKFWKATVVITLNKGVSGAVISGSFNPGGSVSCTTDSDGKCSVTSGNISTNTSPTEFTVSNVNLTGYIYEPSLITSVTISKP
jgi:hypothetical protein